MQPMSKTYVSYLRVSTARQGASGLGLEAQREAVRRYALSRQGEIVAELVEVESGRRSDRPRLSQAIAAARLRAARLLVSKVDRLTRSVSFLSQLLASGVDIAFADLPSVEGPTGKFMLNQMVAVAELERDLIASRTRDALAAAKARGVALGGDRGGRAPVGAGDRGREMQRRRAANHAVLVACEIARIRSEGASLRKLASHLSAAGI